MANNLAYSKLTYSDIVQQITSRINSDVRFQTFRETAIAKMLLEMFAASTDINNYYIERRAEECYLETAKLKSSVIQLSKQLGYVVSRPMPASCSINMVIKGGTWATSLSTGTTYTLQLPIYAPFTLGSTKFVLKNTYSYTLTNADINNFKDSTYSKTIQYGLLNNETNYNLYKNEDLVAVTDLITIDLIQGEKAYYSITSDNNDQIGKKFQVYNIPIKEFSNKYGAEDYEVPITKVILTNDPSNNPFLVASGSEFSIDRRSLLQQGQTFTPGVSRDVCYLRTNMDETIDIVFGDGIYASIGAEKGSKDNIWIQYLSTLGNKGNQLGVIGSKLTYTGSALTINSGLTTPTLEFYLTTDVIGGADLEDIDSIKLNAPSIFYALDRCVTSKDYTAYLKTLTSPINVKNALAWGEQEEGGIIAPIEKLFNVALFTCFGELYKYDTNKQNWDVKDSDTGIGGEMENAVLDNIDIFGGEINPIAIPNNHYYEMVVQMNSPGNTRIAEDSALTNASTKLGQVYTNLKTRSQLTVKNAYVSPIVQEMSLTGNIYCNKLVDATDLSNSIKNDIYSFLNEQADFNVPIYLSNLVDIIENNSGVLYSTVKIEPTSTTRSVLGLPTTTSLDAALIIEPIIVSYGDSIAANTAQKIQLATDIYDGFFSDSYISPYKLVSNGNLIWLKDTSTGILQQKQFITEAYFWKNLIYKTENYLSLLDPTHLAPHFITTDYWKQLMTKLRNTVYFTIRNNMFLDNPYAGIISTVSNDVKQYSLKNELVKLTFEAQVLYK